MDELREWIRAAEAARVTCVNVAEFDVLIRHQKRRLEKRVKMEKVDGREHAVIARKADGPAVFELLWTAKDEIPLEPIFDSDENKKWVSKLCGEGHVWVVKKGHTIIGAMLLLDNEVFYLVVSASHRRQGIGRTLLCEAKCQGRWVRVKPANTAMIKLLESEGFWHDQDHLPASGWHAYRLQANEGSE
jgi:ribosomal protein S18 acetylase RimI-like enzyme